MKHKKVSKKSVNSTTGKMTNNYDQISSVNGSSDGRLSRKLGKNLNVMTAWTLGAIVAQVEAIACLARIVMIQI